jgi:SRSO17 transposase
VGVPAEITFRTKWRIALDQLQRLVDAGVHFGTVLADADYGVCAEFRQTCLFRAT